LIAAVLVAGCAGAACRAQEPIEVSRAESEAHLKVGGVVFPQLTSQRPIDGQVEVRMMIGADGLVKRAIAISGPNVLQGPTVEGVRKWQFIPFTRDGKTVEAIATTVVSFRISGGFHQESQTARAFKDALPRCDKAVNDQAPAAVSLCERAVSLRTPRVFDGSGDAQSESGILLARAYLQAKRTTEAVAAAEQAVTFLNENGGAAVQTMAAYLAAAQAREAEGNWDGSDKELEQAEEYGRLAVANPHKRSVPEAQHKLQEALRLHAEVLTALHRDAEAQAKLKEAAAL
jgi:tetratricopeptide (TPR) repeat protein